MHVLNYAIVSGLRLHVLKFYKRLPAKNETLPFTRVIVSPLLPTILMYTVPREERMQVIEYNRSY